MRCRMISIREGMSSPTVGGSGSGDIGGCSSRPLKESQDFGLTCEQRRRGTVSHADDSACFDSSRTPERAEAVGMLAYPIAKRWCKAVAEGAELGARRADAADGFLQLRQCRAFPMGDIQVDVFASYRVAK